MAMCKIFITIGGFQRHRAIKIPSLNNTDIYDIKSELQTQALVQYRLDQITENYVENYPE